MSQPTTERLAFSFLQTVPSRAAAKKLTFATSPYSEPRDWGYTGLIAFTAVLLLRPQDSFPALEVLHLADVFAFLGIAPMVLHRMARRLPVFQVTPETIALLVLGATMIATAPFSIWPRGALEVFTNTFIKVIIVFVLMLNTLTSTKRLQQITWLVLLSFGYIALRAVLDYVRGVNLIEGGRLAGAVGGIFGNPNDLALNMVAVLPIAAVAALSRRNSWTWRVIAGAIAALMIGTVVFTQSRGGTLGLVAVVLALVLLSRAARPILMVGVLAGGLMVTPFLSAGFYERMATIFDPEADAMRYTGSREARETVMKEGLAAFAAHPFTGVGAGQFPNWNPPERVERFRQTHNAVIQVAADLGIVGLVAFGTLILCGIRAALGVRRMLGARPRKRSAPDPVTRVLSDDDRQMLHELSIGLSAAFIGWFVSAMFASVAYSWTFYYLLALSVAARELIHDRIAMAAATDIGRKPPARRYGLSKRAEPVTA
jgi:putative inorganic carbon (hco3(-)) transporter